MKFLDLFKYSYTLKKIKKKKVILFHGANLESLSKIINKKEIEQINFTNEVNLRIIFSLIFKKLIYSITVKVILDYVIQNLLLLLSITMQFFIISKINLKIKNLYLFKMG